jgi:hypothetical protein
MAVSKQVEAQGRIFADEETRIGFETAEAVVRLARTMPPEDPYMKYTPIRFAEADENRGLTAVMIAGTVVYTGIDGLIVVPERTLEILRTLGIPYQTERLRGY